MLEIIKEYMTGKGYRVFQRPFELNIVGIRSASNIENAFDDTINIFYVDNSGTWQYKSYAATTDPGIPYLKKPINQNGTAILKPGQYIGSHAIGMHRGLYLALVQRAPVIVIRDYNNDGKLDYNSSREEKGMFGINIHRAQEKGTTKYIEGFSAGCQVFANAEDFQQFLQLCKTHKGLYGNVFTYTLLQLDPDLSNKLTNAASPKK
jgi:hypothetical protein